MARPMHTHYPAQPRLVKPKQAKPVQKQPKKRKPKPPMVQRYFVGDPLLNEVTMCAADTGAYVRCLAYQWAHGGIPADEMSALARVIGCNEDNAAKFWTVLGHRFVRGEDGRWRLPRMEQERDQTRRYAMFTYENVRK